MLLISFSLCGVFFCRSPFVSVEEGVSSAILSVAKGRFFVSKLYHLRAYQIGLITIGKDVGCGLAEAVSSVKIKYIESRSSRSFSLSRGVQLADDLPARGRGRIHIAS